MKQEEILKVSEHNEMVKIQSLDLDALANRRGYDKEDIEMMLGIFLKKVDAQLKTIAKAVQEKDYETIFIIAHALRGSLLNIGFDEISEVAKTLELGAKGSQDIQYQKKFLELVQMIDIIKRSTYE